MRKGRIIALGLAGLATFLIPFPKKKGVDMIDENEDTPIPPTEPDSFRQRIVNIARSRLGTTNSIEYAADSIGIPESEASAQHLEKLSWCGLFATWVYQQAGANINWVLGKGIAYQLPQTSNPQPGDLAYIDQPYQHHAIVESVNSDGTITTIDGNSTGKMVAENTRPRSAFTSFYDVGGLDPNLVQT